ncbi:MAG: hypothetical protein PHX21_12965 [bacterium]|nr:hypothetical protein [bacterium]
MKKILWIGGLIGLVVLINRNIPSKLKNDWKCTKCGKYVLNQTDEQMYSRMVTCPYCGQAMVKLNK